MDGLFALSSSFDVLYRRGRDDDFYDRINHFYSTMVLVLFAIFISAKQYFVDSINCWIPVEFSDAWQQYVENYCWIQNTYYVPHDTDLPKSHSYRTESQLSYYQWVPYVLALQAFMFYIPRSFWRLMNWQCGINIQDIIKKAMDVSTKIESVPFPEKSPKKSGEPSEDKKEEKEKENILENKLEEDEKKLIDGLENKLEDEEKKLIDSLENKLEEEEKKLMISAAIKDIAHHLEVAVESASQSRNSFIRSICSLMLCNFGSRKFGSYLFTVYIFTKLFYIINVVGQIWLLNVFVGTPYTFFGFQLLNNLANGNNWKSTGHFPRVTMCDFEIRNLGQRTNYTVQCVLPVNLFNEKIYIFIWLWIFFVGILTFYSLVQWILRMLSGQKAKFVAELLKSKKDKLNMENGTLFKELFNKYLKSDGLFLLYLIYINAGDIVTRNLVEIMWVRFKIKSNIDNQDNGEGYKDIEQFV